jgi:hypothetical protein
MGVEEARVSVARAATPAGVSAFRDGGRQLEEPPRSDPRWRRRCGAPSATRRFARRERRDRTARLRCGMGALEVAVPEQNAQVVVRAPVGRLDAAPP